MAYAIAAWAGRGASWTGAGSWQPLDDMYDNPFETEDEARRYIDTLKAEDVARAWERFSGNELDGEPNPEDFEYRIIDLSGQE